MLRYVRRLSPAFRGRRTVVVRRQGLVWSLDLTHYLDRAIYRKGAFEKRTTSLVQSIVRPGMHVLDVGANFGYHTAICAQCVGSNGRVWAFEPTESFRERIAETLAANALSDRVRVLDLGLSDRDEETTITVGESSATLHPVRRRPSSKRLKIHLRPLDEVAKDHSIHRADFVKVDIDGHESRFLEGSTAFLARHRPILVLEFNQANLRIAGSDGHRLRRRVVEAGYRLFSERTRRPFRSEDEFESECATLGSSANVWAVPRDDPRPRLV